MATRHAGVRKLTIYSRAAAAGPWFHLEINWLGDITGVRGCAHYFLQLLQVQELWQLSMVMLKR
jgi:hypothetical protein